MALSEQSMQVPTQPPLAQSEDSLQANPTSISMHNEDAAMSKALIMLGQQMQSYLPLGRDPGKYTFAGVDLVNHSDEAKPFNAIGHVVFAVHLIEEWEKSIESSLKTRIGTIKSAACADIAVDSLAS